MNAGTGRSLGIREGDWVEVASPYGRTRGQVELVQGCRPDTLVIPGQFQHWKTPFAKDLNYPSLNSMTPMSGVALQLTDATGSGADIVRVRVARIGPPSGARSREPRELAA